MSADEQEKMADYIKECYRQNYQYHREHLRQTHDQEIELLRIRTQAMIDLQIILNDSYSKALLETLDRITIAM